MGDIIRFGPVVSSSRSLLVAPSGGDMTTLREALAATRSWIIPNGTSITINLGAGHFDAEVLPLTFDHPYGSRIKIIGATQAIAITTQVSVTDGLMGVANSLPYHDVVLQAASVAGVSVGDFLLATFSTGSDPTDFSHAIHRGTWEIMNVNTGANRITVRNHHRATVFPTNDLATLTAIVLKSVLKFTDCSSLIVKGSPVGLIQSAAFVGNADDYFNWASEAGAKGTIGLSASSVDNAVGTEFGLPAPIMLDQVGFSNFDLMGVRSEGPGWIYGNKICPCKIGRRGVDLLTGGNARLKNSTASGCINGYHAEAGSSLYATNASAACGNSTRAVQSLSGAVAVVNEMIMHSNVDGVYTSELGQVIFPDAKIQSNTGTGVIVSDSGYAEGDSVNTLIDRSGADNVVVSDFGSKAKVRNAVISNAAGFGVVIQRGGAVDYAAATFTANASGNVSRDSWSKSWDGQVFRNGGSIFDLAASMDAAVSVKPNPGSSTAVYQGYDVVTIGTPASRSITTASRFAETPRVGYGSSASAGNLGGTRNSTAHHRRGDAAGRGGFFYEARFGIAVYSGADVRAFVGLGVAGAPTNVDPSSLFNILGVGRDAADTNWQIMCNDGSGAAAKVNLGANFPANAVATEMIRARFWCLPNDATVYYSVDWDAPGVAGGAGHTVSGSLAADLPVNTQLLAETAWICNNGTAAIAAIDIASIIAGPLR